MRINHRRNLAIAAVAAIYVAVFAIALAPVWTNAPAVLAIGLLFDLTATAGLIVWWGAGLDGAPRRRWTASVVLFGVNVAYWTFPPNGVTDHIAYTALRWGIKASIALLIVYMGWRVVAGYRREGTEGAVEVLARIMPRGAAAPVAAELEATDLAFRGWFIPSPQSGFTAYRETGWPAILILFGLLVIVESVAVHLLVALYSPLIAWILTATSLYTLVWLAAEYQSLRLCPIMIAGSELTLRVGMRWRTEIPLTEIVEVRTAALDEKGGVDYRNLSAPMAETVVITLNSATTLRGPVGISRTAKTIGMAIDDAPAFIEQLRARLRG